jgi:glutathione reductase (NADPH)
MSQYEYDLLTIGAGSGGVAASRLAGNYGARVAICEEGRVGGTCVLRGCVPKKLLVMGSHFREDLDDARGFGWTIDGARLDWGALIRAKDRELDRLESVYKRLLADSHVTLLEGRGRITDPHTVEIAGRRVTAETLLVATGGRPILPPTPGIEHVISSNEALSLPSLPKRVVIVGGGYIGCEFAGIFHGAGADVTMLIRGSSLLRGFDVDVSSALSLAYRAKGIRVLSDVLVEGIEKRPDGRLTLTTKSEDTFEADAVLYATGRAPNIRDLGLEAVQIKVNQDGAIEVDERSRTTVPSIYAVGDCTSRVNLTPVAIAEGRVLVEMLFRQGNGILDHHFIPSAVFSQPPVGTVGLGEEQARSRYPAIDVYATSFRPMRHTLSGRDERMMMKLVVERASQKVIGLHMVGQDAPEVVQGFAVALRAGATKADFDRTLGIHPTAAEEFVTMRDARPQIAK